MSKLLFPATLAFPLLLTVAVPSGASEPAPPTVEEVAPAQVPVLSLCDCRRLALEKQPSLAAARASLAAAQARSRGLDKLLLPAFLAPDLRIRRHQACLSVSIAQAGLNQAEWDTLYAVTRTYLAAVYALQQEEVINSRLKEVEFLLEASRGAMAENRNITERDLEKIAVYLPLGRGRREEARQGSARALAALREAMGAGPDFCLTLADRQLPCPTPVVNRDEVLHLAQSRRGELTQAALAADVVAHEVDAQRTSHLATMRTFASGGDIHARPVPQGESDGEYRPGALALEMPPNLVGPRKARIDQALALHARARAIVDKARDLIALETEDAFYKGREACNKLQQFRDARAKADKLSATLLEDVRNNPKTFRPEQVLAAGILATEARVRYNEALYHYLLALAALERVTAGGFCPGLELAGR